MCVITRCAGLKHVGSNMFREGINLTKISLPVCLFEARSFLERMTTNWVRGHSWEAQTWAVQQMSLHIQQDRKQAHACAARCAACRAGVP